MTRIFLTSAAADAGVTAGSDNKDKADWAAGASARHLNKNTVAGPTGPLQVTDGAAGTDGTLVSWYTEPLWGITIAGQIIALVWDRENAAANNVRPELGIEETQADGTFVATIVSALTNHAAGEMATTAGGATDSITSTAVQTSDTTISDGERLRITLWIDDAVEGTTNMGSGGRGEFWDNGPIGAQGQARIEFTELVSPQAGPNLRNIVEGTHTTTTTPKTLVEPNALNGDRIYVIAFGDGGLDGSNAVSAVTTSTTAGSTTGWTEDFEYLPGSGADGWLHISHADVTADGSVTASTARTQAGTARAWGHWEILVRNHGGTGNVASVTPGGSGETVNLDVSAESVVLYVSVDFNALTAATAFSPEINQEVERATEGGNYTVHTGLWVGQPAGTNTYGTNNTSTSTDIVQVALEILAPAAPSGPALAPLTMAPRIPA